MSAVQVGRLNLMCLVPADHPSPGTVRAPLDAALARQVPAAWARLLAPLCPENDPSVWFIRRLDVDLTVDAACEPERLAVGWAAQLTRILSRIVTGEDDGTDALRFPDRAAYLAQFLSDLVDGSAWSKWYYASLNGLRPLPINAAIRGALCREPPIGEAALCQLLSDGRGEKVLRVLSETDCHTVLTAFSVLERNGHATPVIRVSELKAALRVWQRTPGLTSELQEHAALHLYLALRRDAGSQQPSSLIAASRSLVALARWMASSQAPGVFTALRDGDIAAGLALTRGTNLEVMSALFRCERAAVVRIAEQLQTPANPAKSGAEQSEPLFTPFGGIFFLLPHLGELALNTCAQALPDFCGASPVALVRFLVLLKCLGATRAPRAFFDPLLRELAGVQPDLDAQVVRAWAKQITRKSAVEFQQRWAASRRAYHSTESGDLKFPRPSDADLKYLKLANLLRSARPLDSTLSVIAHGVLRAFAHRLPGFSFSSALFLHANFLDANATIEKLPDRWRVRVTRPLLHVVLAMTGGFQNIFRLPWMDNLEIQLTTGES